MAGHVPPYGNANVPYGTFCLDSIYIKVFSAFLKHRMPLFSSLNVVKVDRNTKLVLKILIGHSRHVFLDILFELLKVVCPKIYLDFLLFILSL